MSKFSSGFTVIEIIFAIAILGFASVLFFIQKNNLEVVARDNQRKTAINSMYYSLEKSFYKQNKYYPTTIDSSNLKTVDPDLFIDPDGFKIGEPESDYRYEPYDCDGNKCQAYNLRTTLEAEDDFVKTNED